MEPDREDLICLDDDADFLQDLGEDEDEDIDLYNEETFALGTDPSQELTDDLFLLCEALGASGTSPPTGPGAQPCPLTPRELGTGSGLEQGEGREDAETASSDLRDPAVMTAVPEKPPLECLDSAILDSGLSSSWEHLSLSAVLDRAFQHMNTSAAPYDVGLPTLTFGTRDVPHRLPPAACLMSPGLESIIHSPRSGISPLTRGPVPFGHLARPPPMRFGSPVPCAAFPSPSASLLETFRFPRHITQLHPQHRRLLSQRRQKSRSQVRKGLDVPVDRYANLMTDKEKAWIIKLQMIQLQSEIPFLQDYYYQEFFRRLESKMTREQMNGEREKPEPQKLVTPYVQKAGNYDAVVHIEGSLGQVAVSTCYSPRRAIDAVHVSPVEETVGRDRLILLSSIEKMYGALLEVEWLDLSTEEDRTPGIERRERTVSWLYENLQLGAQQADSKIPKFSELLSVCKGKKLVSRILCVLPASHGLEVALAIAGQLTELIEMDTDESLTFLFESLSSVVRGLSFSELVSVLAAFVSQSPESGNPLQAAFRNKFSISYLYCLLSHGEHLLSLGTPMDPCVGDFGKWTDTIFLVAKELSLAPKSSMAEPLRVPSNLLALFCRYVDKVTVHQLEDRVESTLQSPRPSPSDVLPV